MVLTCSTLGTALDDALAARAAPVPVLRADAALAQRAVKIGGTVAVLFTAPTTFDPTMQLFLEAATHTGAKVELQMVDGAWEQFKADDYGALSRQSPLRQTSPTTRMARTSSLLRKPR